MRWRSSSWPAATRFSPGRAFAAAIEQAQLSVRIPKLTGAALETLAVISYRQPVGRAEIEDIRGVSAGGVLRTLQERGLIEVVGPERGDGPASAVRHDARSSWRRWASRSGRTAPGR